MGKIVLGVDHVKHNINGCHYQCQNINEGLNTLAFLEEDVGYIVPKEEDTENTGGWATVRVRNKVSVCL